MRVEIDRAEMLSIEGDDRGDKVPVWSRVSGHAPRMTLDQTMGWELEHEIIHLQLSHPIPIHERFPKYIDLVERDESSEWPRHP